MSLNKIINEYKKIKYYKEILFEIEGKMLEIEATELSPKIATIKQEHELCGEFMANAYKPKDVSKINDYTDLIKEYDKINNHIRLLISKLDSFRETSRYAIEYNYIDKTLTIRAIAAKFKITDETIRKHIKEDVSLYFAEYL